MRKTLGDYFVILFSVAGSYASIMAYSRVFKTSLNEQGKHGVIILGIIIISLLVHNICLTMKYRKRIKYADIFSELNNGFSYIHSVDRIKNHGVIEITNSIKSLCNSVSNTFRNIYGHHIGVCIKILTDDGGRPKVHTYCRDERSAMTRLVRDNDKAIEHWLCENTDFQFIKDALKNNLSDCYFFSNALPWKSGYKNSRFGNWAPPGPLLLNLLTKLFCWPLPYKSTIVVPLVPLSIKDQNERALRGFLCIDSHRNFIFNEKFDVHILKGVCDGLYNKIDVIYDEIKDGNYPNEIKK